MRFILASELSRLFPPFLAFTYYFLRFNLLFTFFLIEVVRKYFSIIYQLRHRNSKEQSSYWKAKKYKYFIFFESKKLLKLYFKLSFKS